jgi:hypothetical protein
MALPTLTVTGLPPNTDFQVSSGNRYHSDATGAVVALATDAADLQKSGGHVAP